jgi:acyl carrier protein/NADH dehydrogenase (ubiquinone) 1 alpha/beta subcomplex 1
MKIDPSTHEEIVRRLFEVSDTKLTADKITKATSLRDDLGISSMLLIALALDLQEDLGIVIENDALAKIQTVGDLFETIESTQKQG